MSKIKRSREEMETERNEIEHLIEQLQMKLHLLEREIRLVSESSSLKTRSEAQPSSSDTECSSASKLRNNSGNYKEEVDRLREINSDLKHKIKELVDKNLHWQEFDQHREKKIKELQDSVENLTSELTTLKRNQSEDVVLTTELNFKSDREVELEDIVQQQRNEICVLEVSNTKLTEQIEDYQLQLQQTRSEIRQLQDRIADQIMDVPSEREFALLEENQVLKMQLVAHQEDFESERSDRERAQQQVEDLKRQLNQLRSTNSFYKQPEYTVTSPHWNMEDNNYGYGASEPVQITSRGFDDRLHYNSSANYNVYQTDCLDEVDGETAENVKLSVEEKSAAVRKPADSPVSTVEEKNVNSPSDDDLLTCPRCQQKFDHLELMAHFEKNDCANKNS